MLAGIDKFQLCRKQDHRAHCNRSRKYRDRRERRARHRRSIDFSHAAERKHRMRRRDFVGRSLLFRMFPLRVCAYDHDGMIWERDLQKELGYSERRGLFFGAAHGSRIAIDPPNGKAPSRSPARRSIRLNRADSSIWRKPAAARVRPGNRCGGTCRASKCFPVSSGSPIAQCRATPAELCRSSRRTDRTDIARFSLAADKSTTQRCGHRRCSSHRRLKPRQIGRNTAVASV